jgi:hypothetical protein
VASCIRSGELVADSDSGLDAINSGGELHVSSDNSIVTWWLKALIVEQEEAPIFRQWHSKHISAATIEHATIEELLEVVFSVQSMPRLYSEDQWEN